jgi:EPS-associated MarR family transcriptional regulator
MGTQHLDTHLKVLRALEANPQMNQRELSVVLGVSLGKTNFCLKALLDKGLVKMQGFKKSQNKMAYAYLLTPAGIAQKTELTALFLRYKQQEYVALKAEIEALQLEAAGHAEKA